MGEAELEIERERLQIAKEQLQLEKLKERNASIRFFVGVLLVGAISWAANAAISFEQGRRTLVQSERELILPQLIDIQRASYEEQKQKLRVLRNANFSPEVQGFIKVVASIVEEKHQADLRAAAARQAQLDAERRAQEEETRKKAAEAAIAAQAAQIEAERQRQILEAITRIDPGMSDTAGPW